MILFDTGRTALKAALIKLDKKISSVLVPNFICDVVPVTLKSLNIEVIYYKINDDFTPDLSNVLSILHLGIQIDAFLMVNYFGQLQLIEEILELTSSHGLILIEDNSHGHGGSYQGKGLGKFGEIGFSSPRKILNRNSGGIGYVNGILLNCNNYPVKKSSFINSVKQFSLGLLPQIRILLNLRRDISNPFSYLEENVEDMMANKSESHIYEKVDWGLVARKRRENWDEWKLWLKHNALLPAMELKIESCPWAIPVYIENAFQRKRVFRWLQINGYTPFVWPTLPKEVLEKDHDCIIRWRKLLCIRLDKPPKKLNKLNFDEF